LLGNARPGLGEPNGNQPPHQPEQDQQANPQKQSVPLHGVALRQIGTNLPPVYPTGPQTSPAAAASTHQRPVTSSARATGTKTKRRGRGGTRAGSRSASHTARTVEALGSGGTSAESRASSRASMQGIPSAGHWEGAPRARTG